MLTDLDIFGNSIGPEGGVAIGKALAVNEVLTDLNLQSNNIGGETDYIKASEVEGESKQVGAMVIYEGREMVVSQGVDSDGDLKLRDTAGVLAIAKALEVNAVLTNLRLGYNDLRDEGAVAIADALRVNGVLTNLSLWGNYVGPEGAKAIGGALAVNGVLTNLDLCDTGIRDEGAKALASALRVNGVLTHLSLHSNEIRGEGAKALASALRVNGEVLTTLDLRLKLMM